MAESQFKRVNPGKRWTLAYGSTLGVEWFALLELQRSLQARQPYVIPILPAVIVKAEQTEHLALLGTAENNPLIAGLIESGVIAAPSGAEGYSLAVLPSIWREGNRMLVIAGTDPRGVLYGVEEFAARLSANADGAAGWDDIRSRLDAFPNLTLTEAPAIVDRGIWSWGYVIYDYRRFFDHMARLKLNIITIWNDCAPCNAREVIEYAHARGIRIFFGFHWGWGYEGSLDLSRGEDRRAITAMVQHTYREQYAGLEHDGIYFQTLTEHAVESMAGKTTAAWVCELVNETAGALLAEFPDLSIQLGLHATSIKEHYPDLAALHPRITITWEDAGSLPYSYQPQVTETFEETLDYSRRIAAFRPGVPFALVPKGWMCLRWQSEFENHGPFLLGERDGGFIANRLRERQPEWDVHNAYWFRHFPLAMRFYREMLAVNPHLLASGLIEDGLFEAAIQPSVALFAEILWNPAAEEEEILQRAFMKASCKTGTIQGPGYMR